jgi:hypothetical protein
MAADAPPKSYEVAEGGAGADSATRVPKGREAARPKTPSQKNKKTNKIY